MMEIRKKPEIELTEEQKDTLAEFLPAEWPYCVAKCWTYTDDLSLLDLEIRTSLLTEEEVNRWMVSTAEKMGGKFFRRSIVRSGP